LGAHFLPGVERDRVASEWLVRHQVRTKALLHDMRGDVLPLLIFFRILQGLGGGGLAPNEQAILADTFPPAKRATAFSVYAMAVILAPAIGPTLGGFITDHYSWRWVFFINVPVGVVSLFLSNRMLKDPPHLIEAKKRMGGIDYVGLGLIAVGLGALELVLDKGQEDDWFNSSAIVAFSVIAAVALISFILWEWNHKRPVVDVRLFKSRNFAVSNLMMLVLGMTLYGSTVLLPQYLQIWMGYSATDAGMALSPGALVFVGITPLIGWLVSRVGTKALIAFGFTVLAVALYHMSRTLYPGIDFSTAVWMRISLTVGLAFLFVPINTVVYAGVPPEKNNSVSGIVNLSRNMGGDIGIALVTTVIARRTQVHHEQIVSHLFPGAQAFSAKLSATRGDVVGRSLEASVRNDLSTSDAAGSNARVSGHALCVRVLRGAHGPARAPHQASSRPGRGGALNLCLWTGRRLLAAFVRSRSRLARKALIRAH